MKKRIPAWMMLPTLLLAVSFNFVACHRDAPVLPDYTQQAWYIYLDSAQVRESRGLAHADEYEWYVLRLNNVDSAKVEPFHFRTCQYPYLDTQRALLPAGTQDYTPTREGLDGLNISGSGSYSYKEFSYLVDELKGKAGNNPIYIVNLRQEWNFFVNGHCLSAYGYNNWANIGRSRADIIQGEKELVESLRGKIIITGDIGSENDYQLLPENAIELFVEDEFTFTEEAAVARLAKEKGIDLRSYRLTALDHTFATDNVIDDFIAFYRTVPRNAWVHLHCAGGNGRTSVFMAFFDMLRNPQLPEKDIIYRQCLIGGTCAYYEYHQGDKQWRVPLFTETSNMIHVMKLYAEQNAATGYAKSWSQWKKEVLGK